MYVKSRQVGNHSAVKYKCRMYLPRYWVGHCNECVKLELNNKSLYISTWYIMKNDSVWGQTNLIETAKIITVKLEVYNGLPFNELFLRTMTFIVNHALILFKEFL